MFATSPLAVGGGGGNRERLMLLKLTSLYQKREVKHKRGQLNETPLRESAGKVIKVLSL